jgi:cell division protein FtsB
MTEAKCGRCGNPLGDPIIHSINDEVFDPPICVACSQREERLKYRVRELEAEVENLKSQLEDARAHAASKVGDTVTEGLWDSLWQIAYPDKTDWEYPGQVYGHVKQVFIELKTEVEKLKSQLAELRAKCEEAIPFIMTGDVCDSSHAVDLLRAASGKEESRG